MKRPPGEARKVISSLESLGNSSSASGAQGFRLQSGSHHNTCLAFLQQDSYEVKETKYQNNSVERGWIKSLRQVYYQIQKKKTLSSINILS